MEAAFALTPAAERVAAPSTDADLVAAVRRGDDRAFEQLYERYRRRIASFVFGMVKDHARAEDLTQDAFMSALRRIRETDRPIAFKPWIYEIAKNACIDQFRRQRRAEEVSFDADDALGSADYGRLATPDAAPDAALDAKQQLDDLCGAIDGLSDAHHQILVMREFEGLSYREIGDRLGMSRPSVESTLFRARKRLTEEYDELATGRRCIRVQSLLATDGCDALGVRERRRVARHLSHCSPCRRQAFASGVGELVPGRAALAGRIGALLPIPAFLRRRFGGAHAALANASASAGAGLEPVAGWAKAAAAAGALVLAGVGAGVATHVGGGDAGSGAAAAPASATPAAASPAPAPAAARAAPRTTASSRSRHRAASAAPAASPKAAAVERAAAPGRPPASPGAGSPSAGAHASTPQPAVLPSPAAPIDTTSLVTPTPAVAVPLAAGDLLGAVTQSAGPAAVAAAPVVAAVTLPVGAASARDGR